LCRSDSELVQLKLNIETSVESTPTEAEYGAHSHLKKCESYDWIKEENSLERTLKELKPGEKSIITKVLGDKGAVKRRLMDMGVTRGAEVLVRKVAPLGDPIEVNIRGYELTLRKSEAENIIVA